MFVSVFLCSHLEQTCTPGIFIKCFYTVILAVCFSVYTLLFWNCFCIPVCRPQLTEICLTPYWGLDLNECSSTMGFPHIVQISCHTDFWSPCAHTSHTSLFYPPGHRWLQVTSTSCFHCLLILWVQNIANWHVLYEMGLHSAWNAYTGLQLFLLNRTEWFRSVILHCRIRQEDKGPAQGHLCLQSGLHGTDETMTNPQMLTVFQCAWTWSEAAAGHIAIHDYRGFQSSPSYRTRHCMNTKTSKGNIFKAILFLLINVDISKCQKIKWQCGHDILTHLTVNESQFPS